MTIKQINSMSYNPFSLVNKRVLVTGASSGIGRSIAIECSKLGASLVMTARNKERLAETLSMCEGEGHVVIEADLTESSALDALVNASSELDGVVLCSGIGATTPFVFSTKVKFMEVFETNFFSPVELLRLLSKKKKIKQGGSVVFIVSIGGVSKFSMGNSMYGASKASLNSVIKFCSLELAGRKVRVNGICPGMVDTPLIHGGAITDEQHAKDMENYPLKRYGNPEDIAYGAIYLLSDAASWVTGHSLVIDGGITAK